jgi:DNA processing protein
VLAVPGNPLTGRNRGGHALIRDGAKIVESADDILEELGFVTLSDGAGRMAESSCAAMSSSDSLLVAMEAGEAYDLDGLSGRSGLNGDKLLPRLLDLELRGLVRRVGSGRFMRSA